ncbi:hypothetical protein [Kocuria sp. CPCC 205261]
MGIVDLVAADLGVAWIHEDELGERKLLDAHEYTLYRSVRSARR